MIFIFKLKCFIFNLKRSRLFYDLINILQQFAFFFICTKVESLFRKRFEFKFFVLVTNYWSWIYYHDFIIRFSSAYHEIIYSFKYLLLNQIIPDIFLLPWPTVIIYLYIITIYVNSNTLNILIAFTHMYCLIHPYLL